MPLSEVVILQRAVPHYRLPIFKALYEKFGWVVACGATPPDSQYMDLHTNQPFINTFDFTFPNQRKPYYARVPVYDILAQLKPAAIIAEFSMQMDSTYKLIARRYLKGGPRVIFWSHGYNVEKKASGFQGKVSQLPRLVVGRFADAHLVYSEEGKQHLSQYYPAGRIFVAPNTLDIEAIRKYKQSVKGKGIEPAAPALISLGRFTADKNFPMLIAVFRKVLAAHPNAQLTLIGSGPEEARVRESASDLIGKSVFLPGPIYEEARLAPYFNQTNLAVFTGAVGLSVNHALAYGVPVVAFERSPKGPPHHPEIEYVVDDITGVRVKDYSVEGMASAINQLFASVENPNIALRASIEDFVARHLQLDRMIEGFRQVAAMMGKSS
ncbi:MAG: glycosyltransferase family 4 protein [Candidatus Marinimicrobia bacterium]|nr:glycosyltransferase family 4 protein [Candidatus Neomarinimicrobiota bacterium]